jgi:hypothetical protein
VISHYGDSEKLTIKIGGAEYMGEPTFVIADEGGVLKVMSCKCMMDLFILDAHPDEGIAGEEVCAHCGRRYAWKRETVDSTVWEWQEIKESKKESNQ